MGGGPISVPEIVHPQRAVHCHPRAPAGGGHRAGDVLIAQQVIGIRAMAWLRHGPDRFLGMKRIFGAMTVP